MTRYFTDEHEWIDVDGTSATVGITDFAQRELGDIVYVDITGKGKDLAAEESFGSVEAVKTVSELFLPVAGTIIETNPLLDKQPELVNSDPYGDGWMVKMKVANTADVEALMNAADYSSSVA